MAKQLWQILTKPNLLFSRILRVKYFNGQSIWSSKPKFGDSWISQSIVSTKDLLEYGLRRRVGDGKTIKIWSDRWLTSKDGGKVRTKEPRNCPIQRVQQLILEGKWNDRVLNQWFCETDGEDIKQIPISVHGRPNRLF